MQNLMNIAIGHFLGIQNVTLTVALLIRVAEGCEIRKEFHPCLH